jgi:CheY-like chemotaxis protein
LIDILLVEDNPDHAVLIKRVLEDYKVSQRVYIVEGGEEALDFIYHKGEYSSIHDTPRPGLVLLDLKLPRMDGFKVLRQLKSDPDYRSIPVVILTTSSRDEEIAKGYAEGANSYVTKPVNFDEFTDKVRSIGSYWSLVNPIAEQSNI